MNVRGLNIAIENPIGSFRRGVDKNGQPWETKFNYPYGYIENTRAKDNEEIDCYVGDNPESDKVFIIHQLRPDGLYDEDKVILQASSLNSARDIYLSHVNTQGFLGRITEMPFFEFKDKIERLGKSGLRIK